MSGESRGFKNAQLPVVAKLPGLTHGRWINHKDSRENCDEMRKMRKTADINPPPPPTGARG